MSHPHAPHTLTMSVELRLFEQKATGEYVSAEQPKTLIFSLPCRNMSEGKEAKMITEEAIKECLTKIKLQMFPEKQKSETVAT